MEMDCNSLLKRHLPDHFNAHLSPAFLEILKQVYQVKSSGLHYKMGLSNLTALPELDMSQVVPLDKINRTELQELYRISYPDNWFNERMLETGQYFGLRMDGQLVSVAGVHVYSEKYRVAALGNITTHPRYRNQGLAEIVTTCLCKKMALQIDHIGLNVHTENHSAIRCYRKIGFEIMGRFEECQLSYEE
jgi:predicted GNAT family acetyltransferase